jgi:hypothetical protein
MLPLRILFVLTSLVHKTSTVDQGEVPTTPTRDPTVAQQSWYNTLLPSNCVLWYNNLDDITRLPSVVNAYWTSYLQRDFLGWDSGAVTKSVWTMFIGYTRDG